MTVTKTTRAVDQYLTRYAEPESSSVPIDLSFDNVLVIPAFRESPESLAHCWRSLPERDRTLIIIVLNAPPGRQGETVSTLAGLSQRVMSRTGALVFCRTPDNRPLLLVDRCSNGQTIPVKHGVGLARKIGADIALALWRDGKVRSPFIHSTDADTQLPVDYFTGAMDPDLLPNTSALVFPFLHQPSPGTEEVCYLYEISLHYYVAGLRWAGSPYAFHTIGSTLAFRAQHYAEVRGFPQRSAGEDFYLLNKLAKRGPVVSLTRPVLNISGRVSDRVPVGTGPGIRKLQDLTSPRNDMRYYHPDCFIALRELLALLPIADEPGSHARGQFAGPIAGFLKQTRLLDGMPPAGPRRQRFLHDRFDGFQTLKFIHYIREHVAPSVTLSHALAAPFIEPLTGETPVSESTDGARPTTLDATPLADLRNLLAGADARADEVTSQALFRTR